MSSEREYGLLPLHRNFTQARHGFDRNQVRQYMDYMENEVRQLISERDAALTQVNTTSEQLEEVRSENTQLRARVDELNKPPETMEDLDERMQRTITVANDRAADIVNRAQVAAEEHWQRTVEESQKLRDRYSSLLAQLESHAEALHSEHQQMLDSTRSEVTELTEHAVTRRAQLDDESEQQRRSIEQEFDDTMSAEREKMERYISEQRESAKNEAEQRIAEAKTEAERLVDEAKSEAGRRLDQATTEAERVTTEAQAESDRLRTLHQQARERLRKAEQVLAGGNETLAAVDGEQVTLPEQQTSPRHLQSTSQGEG